ncbi:MAG TPA: DUF2877 domain-containing protein [bacterium]|nr:DUF2877 domain-containing protein [bacterium]
MMHDVQAVSMSWRIGRQLREPGWSGEVLAVHDRSCYLVGERSEIVAIVQQPLGNNPLGLVVPKVDGLFQELSAGVSVMGTGDRLGLGDGLTIGLEHAALWDPKGYPGLTVDDAGFSRCVVEMYGAAVTFSPETSLARLLPHLQDEDLPESLAGVAHFPRSHALIGGLVEALTQRNQRRLKVVTASLAGLGPGLTPAGDDFLGGVLVALAFAHEHQADAQLAEIAGLIVETAAPRTHEISAAYLRAAYAGEVSEGWHPLIRSLATGDAPGVLPAARAVMAHGETSGADMLAGFLAGLGGIYRMSAPSWSPAMLSAIGTTPSDPPSGNTHA